MPKQNNFFALFQQAAHQVVEAAEQFAKLVSDVQRAEQYASIIAKHEATADNFARNTYDLLHKTFITPFDRHDIHCLTRKLDDILDIINRTAQRIALYQFSALPAGIEQIAGLVLTSTQALKVTLGQLENLKNTPDIIQRCRIISEADNKAEDIMLRNVSLLFVEEQDFKQLLKTKEIYEYSTEILHECHHLADIIKGIVLEYA